MMEVWEERSTQRAGILLSMALGQPTLYLEYHSSGLPIGLQIVAKPSADLDVLSLNRPYELSDRRGVALRHGEQD